MQTNCEFVAISPPLSGDDMKKVIEPIIQEYFENADTYDAAVSTSTDIMDCTCAV